MRAMRQAIRESGLVWAALLIIAGFADLAPLDNLANIGTTPLPGFRSMLIGTVLAPFTPLIAVLLLRVSPLRLPAWLAVSAAALVGIPGGMASLLSAALGAGMPMPLTHGLALTLSCVAALLLLVDRTTAPVTAVTGRRLLVLPVILALWSLIAAGVVATSASLISRGQPYCIAEHDQGPVTSLADLRGFSFYTTRTGDKETSRWFFHGMLLVQIGGDRASYNWSPRRIRFSRLSHPENLVVDPTRSCQPVPHFLRHLSWL